MEIKIIPSRRGLDKDKIRGSGVRTDGTAHDRRHIPPVPPSRARADRKPEKYSTVVRITEESCEMEFGNQNARKRILARLLAEQHAQEIKTLVGEFLVAVDTAREAEGIVRNLGSITRYSTPSAHRRRGILLEKLTEAFELWLQLADERHYADPRISGIKVDAFQVNRRLIHGN